MTSYREQLRHPKWQRRRLERLEAAGWKCADCSDADSELHVHHERYIAGRAPWEYEDALLAVLCDRCHALRHGLGPRRPAYRVSHAAAGLLDLATWVLINRCELWATLDGEAHDLLAGQGAPYDAFFGCIERLLHEQGPLGAAALREELATLAREAPGSAAVLARISAFHEPEPATDLGAKLHSILDLLRLQDVDEELKLLFEAGPMSPDAELRGQFLQAERQRLKRAAA